VRGSLIGAVRTVRRILWCGGSHLAHARPVLERQLEAEDFFVTAGPELNRWSAEGGRYRVEGSRVGGTPYTPTDLIDLSDFDRIVFIGQWVQPHKWFNSRQLLSRDVLEVMFQDDAVLRHAPDGAFNEPLLLFPKLAPNRCVLACDPFPHTLSHWPAHHCRGNYRDIPPQYLERFYAQVQTVCSERGVTMLLQPRNTCTNWVTDAEHSRGDQIHMTETFWERYVALIGKSLSSTD